MPEKSTDSNVWLSRGRRDGRTGVAEPCFAQLCVDVPKACQPVIEQFLHNIPSKKIIGNKNRLFYDLSNCITIQIRHYATTG